MVRVRVKVTARDRVRVTDGVNSLRDYFSVLLGEHHRALLHLDKHVSITINATIAGTE